MTVICDHYGMYGRKLRDDALFRVPIDAGGLGSDDIDLMELVLTLEELFGVYIEPLDIRSIESVHDMLELVSKALKEGT